MDKIISEFIDKQKLASVCCVDEINNPYCFSVFYIFDKSERRLFFKSSSSSNHSSLLLQHKKIAGTIVPDKFNVLAIKGVQFTGCIMEDASFIHHYATAEYHKRIPMAFAMSGEVWTIQLETIKMTDNTISLDKKICWQRENLYEDVC